MSKNVNEITLKYLMNPIHYDRYLEETTESNKEFLVDKKFYRKRIINITKNMFKDQFESDHLKDIFDLYIQNLISYFKEIDTKDIIQREYKHLVLLSKEPNILDKKTMNKIDSTIFVEPKPQTLNSFVKIVHDTRNDEKLPIQKDIDLKDPKLKKKGIKQEKKDKKGQNIKDPSNKIRESRENS